MITRTEIASRDWFDGDANNSNWAGSRFHAAASNGFDTYCLIELQCGAVFNTDDLGLDLVIPDGAL